MFDTLIKNIYLCTKQYNYELEKDFNTPRSANNC